MKRFIILILLSLLFAGEASALIVGYSRVSGAAPSYTDIIFHEDFEDNTTFKAAKPSTLTATTHTLTYSTNVAYVLSGTYAGAYTSNTYDKVGYANTGDAVFDRVDGSVGVYFNTATTIIDDAVIFESYYDASNYLRFRYRGTTGLEILWVAGGNTYQAYVSSVIAASTAYYVSFSYGASASDFNIYLDGVSQTLTKVGTLAAMSATPVDGTIAIGSSNNIGGCLAGEAFDQWIISTDKTRDLYALRLVTDFN